MEMICSAQNPLIKEVKKLRQKKYREERGEFLLEGVRLVEEGVKADRLKGVFFADALTETARGRQLLDMIEGLAGDKKTVFLHQVSPQVIKTLAETENPQGIVAVACMEKISPALLDTGREEKPLLVIDGLQDPGNLGTLIRTAWGAGARAVVCLPGTVEPYNGKTVRSSMGGIFRVPVINGVEWGSLLEWLRRNEYCLVAGDPSAEKVYSAVLYPRKTALIIGNEGQGFVNVKPEQVHFRVRIPLHDGAESLNAAVAGGILLYEIIRMK